MKFNINSCKRGNWQIKEQVDLGIGTFYLLTDADGYYRHAQIACEDGSIMNEEVYTDTLAAYAAHSRWSQYADEQAFSAAYRQWVIDKFVKDFTFVSDCFLFGWNKEQQTKYFYAPAENSVELAAFAYKVLGLKASDAGILLGMAFWEYPARFSGMSRWSCSAIARERTAQWTQKRLIGFGPLCASSKGPTKKRGVLFGGRTNWHPESMRT